MKHWRHWEEMQEAMPGFDGTYLEEMSTFSYEVLELPPYYDKKPCLTSVFLQLMDGKMYDVSLRFIGVSSLKLDMHGDWLVGDIKISREPIEEIQFYVNDYEHGTMSFYCEEVEFLGVQESVEENLKRALTDFRILAGMVEPDCEEIVEALEVLKEFGERPVVAELLLQHVTHENQDIRDAVYEYLWYVDDPRTIGIACEGLQSEDALQRIKCLEILGKWGDGEVVPQLLAVLEKDGDALVRCYAAEAIGATANEATVSILQRLLLEEQDDVAKMGIVYGLERLGHRDLDLLFENLANDYYIVRIRIVLYLTEIALEDPRVLAAIVRVLKEYRDEEKTVAAREAFDRALEELGK
ncbi:HEAT repeat domain-containing protein [Listeria grandensis]|uniref:HEAT repeat domain-containing protein n=1 Tax=Listeria grandensis TaxID=1494963 RepID=A0A7X1CQA0_9LIST|nr:HEAT repeat domain-containing protein [Listeria grandensis]MBC1936835.1 HEAT repeat domain-containing protein [Listeria grandensis]